MTKGMIRAVLVALLVVSVTAVVTATGSQDTGSGPIKVGMYQDLSAGTAQWGTDSQKGAELRIKDVNAAGGVLGRQIQLVTYDCKGSPTESVKNYTRLVQEDKVCAVYGSLNSNTGLAVGPVAEPLKVPVVTRCMDERVTTPDFKPEDPDHPGRVNPYTFVLQPSCYQQSAMIAGYAIDELKFNTFAMLFTPSNAYSYMMAKGFEYYLAKRGKKLVGSFEFQAGDLDYRAQLTKVKALNPDALFVPGYVTENANAAKQAKELGLKSTLLGNNSWFEPLDQVAGDAGDGAYFPLNVSRDNPKLQWYIEKYEKAYGEKPRLHSFSGWDDMGFLLEAIKKAKSTDPEKIRTAMEEMRKFEGVIGTINMDAATHRSYGLTMSILKIVGSKFTTVAMAYYPKQVK
jgi:branched-chain amino acid transport system substrate-binding protein